MRNMLRWILLISYIVAFTVGGIGWAAKAEARDVVKLNYAHPFPEKFPFNKSEIWFANEINKRGKGKVQVKVYWGGSLGKTAALPGLIRSGGVDIAAIVPGYYPGEFPLCVGTNNVFFVNKTREEAVAVVHDLYFKGPMNDELNRHNMKPLFAHVLNPYNLWTREPVEDFDDLSGLKIRTWGPYLPKLCETVGAIGVEMVVAEWFEGMERGAVGAGLFANDMAMFMKVNEVAKHCTTVNFGVTSGPVIAMNTGRWNSLPQDVKDVFLDVMDEMPDKELEVAYSITDWATRVIEERGVKVHEFPKEKRQEWISKTPSFAKMWLDNLKKSGLEKEGKECWKQWQEILAEMRSQ